MGLEAKRQKELYCAEWHSSIIGIEAGSHCMEASADHSVVKSLSRSGIKEGGHLPASGPKL
jgi:hypothetical protein